MPIEEGEEVTITYTNLLRDTNQRNQRLQRQWYFKCECPRCRDPSELGSFINAIRCPNCGNGFLLPETESEEEFWSCGNCDKAVTAEAVERLKDDAVDQEHRQLSLKLASKFQDIPCMERSIGLLRINALESEGGRGRIFFPTFSFLSHSCTNNARHVVETKESSFSIK